MSGPDHNKSKMIGIPERHINPVSQHTQNGKGQIVKKKKKTNFANTINIDFKKSLLGDKRGDELVEHSRVLGP